MSYKTKKNKKNMDLNEFRKVICLRKSEVSVERISVCNVIENLGSIAYTVCMFLYQ